MGKFIISDEEIQKQVSVLDALEAFVVVCQKRVELDNYAIDDMRHEFLDYLNIETMDDYYPHWKRDVSPCVRKKCSYPAACCGCEEYTEWKMRTRQQEMAEDELRHLEYLRQITQDYIDNLSWISDHDRECWSAAIQMQTETEMKAKNMLSK